MIKPRSKLVAAIFSLVAPGLGHIYAGDLKKGLILAGVFFGVTLLAGLTGLLPTFYGFVFYIVLMAGVYIYTVVSSVILAGKNKNYELKTYNRWYWYLAFFVFCTVIWNIFLVFRDDILGYQSFRIVAKNMQPTLEPGDVILVDTRNTQVDVGDVVVFHYPIDKRLSYVKRVAALGGDTVSIVGGVVYRNGGPEERLSVPDDNRKSDISMSMPEISVPPNEIFFLGDWRDNSNDSRFWGTVADSDVIGRVTYIWMSKELQRIGRAIE